MKITSIIKLSLTNLFRRKLRSFLTILGVSIAIGVLFFLVNTAESLKTQIKDFVLNFGDGTNIQVSEKYEDFSLADVASGPKVATAGAKPKKVTDKTILELRKISHIRSAYPNINTPNPGLVELTLINKKSATSSAVLVTSILAEDIKQIETVYKSKSNFLKSGEFFQSNENDAIITQDKLAQVLKVKVGESLTLKVELLPSQTELDSSKSKKKYLGEFTVKVIGEAKKPPNRPGNVVETQQAIISYSLNKKLYDLIPIEVDPSIPKEFREVKGEYYAATVYVDNIENVRKVQKNIQNKGYSALTLFDGIDAINQFFLILQVILAIFSLVGLIIALIGISNTMFMSTLERTKEIGILKALGAKDSDIYNIFLFESAAFGIVGALVGITFASLMGFIFAFAGNMFIKQSGANGLGLGDISIHYIVDPKILIGTIIFSIILAMIAGFLPARKASKLDPIKALRYE